MLVSGRVVCLVVRSFFFSISRQLVCLYLDLNIKSSVFSFPLRIRPYTNCHLGHGLKV